MGSEVQNLEDEKLVSMRPLKVGCKFVKGLLRKLPVIKRINLISPSIIVTNTLKALYGESQINELKKTIHWED